MGERNIIWDTDKFATQVDSSCPSRTNTQLLVLKPEFVTVVHQFSKDYFQEGVTSGKKEPTLKALNEAGLLDSDILQVLSGEEIDSPQGRLYRPVARRVGLKSDEDVKAGMVVVGIQPTDVEGLVTIKPPSFCGGLEIVRDTVKLLEGAGDGNFSRGFAYLYQQPSIIERSGSRLEQRYAQLCGGERIMLNYCDRDGFAFGEYPRRFPVVEIANPPRSINSLL
jgi:hypothetical protein